MRRIVVGEADFDSARLLADLESLGGGAVASFTGLVRGEDGLSTMTLDHYPAMTESALAAIASQAETRWPLLGLLIVHHVGVLRPGDRIVFVGTASSHRAAALDACHFLIDWLKTEETSPYFFALEAPAPTASWRLASGTRNIVWQCWHFTSFPRTSSGTDRIFRQRRLGQIS